MTKLIIVNLALAHLGQKAITQAQLDAGQLPSAVAVNLFWEPCRDEVLGESQWSFATSTVAISTLAISDDRWSYVYSFPTYSVGSLWNIFNYSTADKKEINEYEVRYVPSQSDKCIFTDVQDAIAEITYKVTDPEIWSEKFSIAFSYRLASSMCMLLINDPNKALQLMDIYNVMISEAKRINSSEKIKKPYRQSNYIDAR